MPNAVVTELLAAQNQFKNLAKTAVNPHFGNGYTPLPDVLDAVRPILTKHGLVLTQTMRVENGLPILVTTIHHKDGDTLTSEYPLIPARNDPQGLAGALTYARRYALMALLGIASDDDDGNRASATHTCHIHDAPMFPTKRMNGTYVLAHKADPKDPNSWCLGLGVGVGFETKEDTEPKEDTGKKKSK